MTDPTISDGFEPKGVLSYRSTSEKANASSGSVFFGGVSFEEACEAARGLDVLARFIHGWAVSKGWWENADRPFAEQMANFHAELSEAWEEYRSHGLDVEFFNYRKEDNPTKPEGITVELIDAVVRILDTCGRYNMQPGTVMQQKLVYNCTRPHRHGGKHA